MLFQMQGNLCDLDVVQSKMMCKLAHILRPDFESDIFWIFVIRKVFAGTISRLHKSHCTSLVSQEHLLLSETVIIGGLKSHCELVASYYLLA